MYSSRLYFSHCFLKWILFKVDFEEVLCIQNVSFTLVHFYWVLETSKKEEGLSFSLMQLWGCHWPSSSMYHFWTGSCCSIHSLPFAILIILAVVRVVLFFSFYFVVLLVIFIIIIYMLVTVVKNSLVWYLMSVAFCLFSFFFYVRVCKILSWCCVCWGAYAAETLNGELKSFLSWYCEHLSL